MNARQFRNQYAKDHGHIDWDCMVDDTKLKDIATLEDDVMEKYKSHKSDSLPDVRCFKAYGEELIKELDFELEISYAHDQYKTNRYRKGLLLVEFTYAGDNLVTVDLTIDETYTKPITFEELKAITPVLGYFPE